MRSFWFLPLTLFPLSATADLLCRALPRWPAHGGRQAPYPLRRVTNPVPSVSTRPWQICLCLFLWGVSQLLTFEVAGKEFSNNNEVSESTETSDEQSRSFRKHRGFR